MILIQRQTKSLLGDLFGVASKLTVDVSPKNIHKLRTTARRIESLVTYSDPDLGKKQKKTLEELTSLRKRAGKIRDVDVQLGLLGSVANGSTASDRRVLTLSLKEKRERQAKRLISAAKKLKDSKFFPRMERIAAKSAEKVLSSKLPGPLQKAQAELNALAGKFASDCSLKPPQLHQCRLQLKLVRYVAELAEDSAEKEHFLASLKSVQDSLGHWHDWEILSRTTEKQFKDRVNCPLVIEVRSLLAASYSAASSALSRLFSTYVLSGKKKQPRPVPSAETLVQHA